MTKNDILLWKRPSKKANMSLKEDRTRTLLEAAYALLKQQEATEQPINLLNSEVEYDDSPTNGQYLLADIGMHLGVEDE